MLPLTGAQSLVMSLSFRTFSLGYHLFFSVFFLYIIVDASVLLNLGVSGDSVFGCSCVLAKDLECHPDPQCHREGPHISGFVGRVTAGVFSWKSSLFHCHAFFQWKVHSLLIFFSPAPPSCLPFFPPYLNLPSPEHSGSSCNSYSRLLNLSGYF